MKLFYSIKSDYDYIQTKLLVKEALAKAGFSILAELNLGEIMRSKDLDFNNELHVLEVCIPAYAFAVLNADPDAKYLLPCKITLSKEDDVSVGIVDYEAFNDLGYSLSKTEASVLKEIKKVISIVKK